MKNIYKLSDIFRRLTLRKLLLGILALGLFISCENFVEIDPPNNQLTGEIVFKDASTVNAALIHIYSQLRGDLTSNGLLLESSYLLGHYTDELTLYSTSLPEVQFFFDNNLLASNSIVSELWNTSYNLVHATNNIIEGVQNATALTQEDKDQFLGEAYFIRAFIHFYMVNLFGDIPYVDTTDYKTNSEVSRLSEDLVYQNLINDLVLSKSLLSADIGIDRVRPNEWVAVALLARVYLYQQNWELALNEASEIISSGTYILNMNTNQIFLKSSTETLWQFDAGIAGSNTLDAQRYIFTSGPPPNTALSSHFIDSFETGDTRFTNWVGEVTDGIDTWYYPFKYKLNTNTATTEECSIVFRLAELYLISAEANAQLGNPSEALNHLNTIRERANLAPITFTDNTALLNAIYQERKIEFFTEHAHRFFDLKRTGRANSQLSPVKPNWDATDILLPIPESELIINPNLEPQNEGY